MKRLLPLALGCLAATAPAATVAEHLATAAECGLPPLRFHEAPCAPDPLPEREWQLADGRLLKAQLTRILDYGSKQARAVLRDPEGVEELLRLEDMRPGDRLLAEHWVESRGFIALPLMPQGRLCARIMEVRDSSHNKPHAFYEIQLMTPDGRIHLRCCNAEPITEAQAGTRCNLNGRDSIYFTDAGVERLKAAKDAPKETKPQPILMASCPAEARAYAELHGLTAVTVYLNQRGSEIDLAWKEYLRRHPEAGAHWNSKYVFVGIYCDERGNYPAELLQEIHAALPYGHGGHRPPAALGSGCVYKGVPQFFSSPDIIKRSYSIAEILATPPDQIIFRN